MNENRFVLEPYSGKNSRYRCPECQKSEKTFTHYIDTKTGQYISRIVGRCSREYNCAYHYTPKQYFHDNKLSNEFYSSIQYKPPPKPTQKPFSLIPTELMKKSLKHYENNNFVKYLINLFGIEITNRLVSEYFIGTSKYWDGTSIFWQIDLNGKVRTGKIMLYNTLTGKRFKEPNHINWVHKLINQPKFELKQCFFGEHLLNDKTKQVAIVESEKTAIIASVYFPKFIWLAVGSLNNLNVEKCEILKGRKVILFPDLKGFDKWSKKANELSYLGAFTVSDLLERKANEEETSLGLDLADYLVRFNYKEFIF